MKNPFILEIAQDSDFCNRVNEISELITRAHNSQNVFLYSPRRYGKSSLVTMVQKQLEKEGFINVYVDLFPISSESDVITKISTAIFKGLGKGADPRKFIDRITNIFKRFIPSLEILPDRIEIYAKFDRSDSVDLLLEDLMESMYSYVRKHKIRMLIVLDEFQEIVVLNEAKKIEGTLRYYIQQHRDISYFFVGSRRRLLTEMFTDRGRPFYKSAYPLELGVIKKEDFVPHIIRKFKETKKSCSEPVANLIYDMVRGYPYYVQKLSALCWDISTNVCSDDIVKKAYETLLKMEKADYESIWAGLTLSQKALLKAIAKDPIKEIFSMSYMKKHDLTIGGIQKALDNLIKRDIIEVADNVYRVTDPVMAEWLFRST